METFVVNLVSCTILKTLLSIILPEGKMKKFVSSVVGMVLFYCLIVPIVSLVDYL